MADAGGRALVIEKTDEVGGTLHLSAGSLSAAGTKRQRDRGIEDDAVLHAADVMRITNGAANESLVRLATEEAAATVDWLDEFGYAFDETTPLIYQGYEPYTRARVYYGERRRSGAIHLQGTSTPVGRARESRKHRGAPEH
jgi:fumarate reductase flavoprotein subunit